MCHTIPDPLIYVFLSLASHDADVFSSAPPIKTFSVESKNILRLFFLKTNVWNRFLSYRDQFFQYAY